MYNLNKISLESLGFIPGRQDNSNIALSGFLDMPSRLGTTQYDWAGESGVEPYLSADEIFFGGRDLVPRGFIKGNSRADCESKRLQIVSLIDSFTDLVPLESKWGEHNVYVNGAVNVEFLQSKFLKITIPMHEPMPIVSGVLPAADDSELGIDGISFKSLGGTMLELSGDRRNRPAPKSVQFTTYGKEGYAITKTVSPELNLKLYIKQPNYAAFKEKVQGMMALLSSPGLRHITGNNDSIRSFFVKDGFVVNTMYSKSAHFTGVIECKLTQAGIPVSVDNLNINGSLVTINAETIQIKL